jgi:LysR family transcriptional activator of glutamate synthase operon
MYFDAVIREGGFTKAARQLHVAQPAISAQVRQLEAELGVTLIQRGTRSPVLTQAGELLLVHARQVLAHIEAARLEMAGISSVTKGTVRIGATQVLGAFNLAASMASFRLRYPGVAMTLRSGLLDELVAQLDAGALDVVIGPEHAGLRPRHRVEWLADERLVLAVPMGHPLAAATGPIDLAECRDEPFICLPPGSGMHALLLQAASTAEIEPRIDFQADDPGSIRDLVAVGLGVALMAASTTTGPGAPVATCELVRLPRHPPITVITPSKRTAPATRAFADYLRHRASLTLMTDRKSRA